MLRAVSVICVESQSLQLLTAAKRDVYKLFRTRTYSTAASANETVVRTDRLQAENERVPHLSPSASSSAPPTSSSRPPPPPPPPPPSPNPRRAWTVAAAALALTASLGGVYYFRKQSPDDKPEPTAEEGAGAVPAGQAHGAGDAGRPVPASGDALPRHVQYLLVGAGTASFAAMRAIRSHRPHAQVLLVGEEPQLPYMRPPLSKELWREPGLAAATDLDALTFRQWNGRTRSVSYEPAAFYAPVEGLAGAGGAEGAAGGAAVARGWRVVRVDAARHEAELRAPGCEPVVVRYDKCLIATGVRPRRAEALRGAARAGLALTVRSAGDSRRLAAAVERTSTRTVALLGGGFLATELSAALAEKVRDSGKNVVQIYREEAPLAHVLPPYLAAEAARRLRAAGVTLLPLCDIVSSEVEEGTVRMRTGDGREVRADVLVECVGGEVDEALARASALELHPELGGLLVNAELQARTDVYAAGDVACFYDQALGRRRVEHHDHAVASGRLAGENMVAGGDLPPPRPYTHQSMFWSDLGPHLGYEAIGIIDSRLPTVGVFSADAVTDAAAARGAGGGGGGGGEGEADACARRYERGVVLYVRGERVVGVLLWNLFNRMHLARQVLAQGEFEDLFEVAKLFGLHENE